MKKYTLSHHIPVFCRTVSTFPLGIGDAFDALMHLLPSIEGRHFYGISYFDADGKIVYKVAVSELTTGEAEQYNCEPYTILHGNYLCETMWDWRSKTDQVKDVFMRLMEDPQYDPAFPCIEWYKTDDELLCLVRNQSQQ